MNPGRTAWHITFGTYGTRLHGDDRPTVERTANTAADLFVGPSIHLRDHERRAMQAGAVTLSLDQRRHVEQVMSALCEKGSWTLLATAAQADHVHILLDADPAAHGKQVRRWLKAWLTQSLNEAFGAPPRGWWAEGGSTKPAKDERYFRNVISYINHQRTTPL